MNVSDGELMQGVLAAHGYDIVARPEEADVVLVNTCAIREHAEQRVIGRVGELNRLKAERPDLVIGVTGCMAQRLGETLLERRVRRPRHGPGRLSRPAGGARPDPRGHPGSGRASGQRGRRPPRAPAGVRPRCRRSRERCVRTAAARSGLPCLADRLAGCSSIPRRGELRGARGPARVGSARGCPSSAAATTAARTASCRTCAAPEKNRSPERVLDEVRGIAEQGITEVTLLGQTVNSWNHGDWRFPRLLRAVARVDGIRRVRFTSPHPNDVTPELVEVMATEPGVCRQLHLPVQSGHDRTLKRMLRRYTVASTWRRCGWSGTRCRASRCRRTSSSRSRARRTRSTRPRST
jgi:tRNA-2-methylthio-N6-dimethylallyladenosine synthase